MRRAASLLIVVAVAGSTLLAPRPALACSCSALPVADLVEAAGSVFVGTVTEIERVAPSARSEGFSDAIVQVEQVYKAALPASVRVRTPPSVASCGIPFLEGSQYLVFAEQEGRVLRSDLCFGTTADVALLAKNGYTSQPPGGEGIPDDLAGGPGGGTGSSGGGKAGSILLALMAIGGVGFVLRRELNRRGGIETLLRHLPR